MTPSSDRLDPRLPVLIGGGQLNQRVDQGEPPLEPVDMIAEAARRAEAEASTAGVLAAVDSVRIVGILSWRYRDPGRLVAERVGASPRTTWYTGMGGNLPQSLVNQSAIDIAAGRADIVLVGGAEAWRTRTSLKNKDEKPQWTRQPDDVQPTQMLGDDDPMIGPAELARGVMMPVQVYPMFESAWRAHNGWSLDEHRDRLARLWSRFSEVAASNPAAWIQQAYSPAEVITPSPENRMVGLPYPKRLNSNNAVEQSAAVLLCSVEAARSLGVPPDRWVFLHAGTDGQDTKFVSNRRDLHSSPAVDAIGRRAYELAGVGPDDVAHIDLYSCFPSSVQIGANALHLGSGLGDDRPLTVTGGLCFAGGPWNDYVTHAIATMAGRLRDDPGSIGLVWANGGFLTKHAIGIYSTEPPGEGFRHDAPQGAIDAAGSVEACEEWDGPVTVEAYTVMHDRDGQPELGLAALRLSDGRRAWGRSTDPAIVAELVGTEAVGRTAKLSTDGTLDLA